MSSVFGENPEEPGQPFGGASGIGLALPIIPEATAGGGAQSAGIHMESEATAGAGGSAGAGGLEDRRQLFRAVQSYYKGDADKFNGRDDEDVMEFLETYESLVTVAGASTDLGALMFQFVIAGAAKDFFRMMRKEERSSWDSLKSAFTRQYASAARRQRLAHKYQALKQQTFYGLDAYYKELMDTARQLPEAYRAPEMLRDKFVSGLHPALREAVTLVDPPTLQAAFDRAKLALQSRRVPPEQRRTLTRPPWRSQRRSPDGKDRDTVGAIVTSENKTNRAARRIQRPIECWRCGETGHMKRDCPKRLKGTNSPRTEDEQEKNE